MNSIDVHRPRRTGPQDPDSGPDGLFEGAASGHGPFLGGRLPPSNQWQALAVVGAVPGLAALARYVHSFYSVAIVIDVVILVLVWGRLVAAR
jgi:hypothetical protein